MSSDDIVMELVAWERSRSRADRIEVLEAALRMIILSSKDGASIEIARAALAPEQEKSVNVFDLLARYPEQDK